MNIKKITIAVLLVLAILLMPISVFAKTGESTVIELYQKDFDDARIAYLNNDEDGIAKANEKGIYYTDFTNDFELNPGEYKFMEDIDLGKDSIYIGEGDFILDLNGSAIVNSEDEETIGFYDGNLTIKGEGTIENLVNYEDEETGEEYTYRRNALVTYFPAFEDASVNVVIESGTFIGGMTFHGATVTIEDADVIGQVSIDASNLTINAGTYSGSESDAVYAFNGATLTINDGEFASLYVAVSADPGAKYEEEVGYVEGDNVEKVTICGGTYTGGVAALGLEGVEVVSLKGGIFTADGENAIGAIVSDVEGLDGFMGFLAEGYMYAEDLEISELENQEGYYHTQNVVSVIYAGLEITDGDDQTFEEDDLTVTCSGLYTHFVGLVRNGEEDVDSENYGLESGSTILTLKASYLASLDAGVHTFTMLYTNDRSIDFTVTIPEPITPKTGDNIAVYIVLFVISVVGIVSIAIISKKKKK